MKKIILALLVGLVLAACGPSEKELQQAVAESFKTQIDSLVNLEQKLRVEIRNQDASVSEARSLANRESVEVSMWAASAKLWAQLNTSSFPEDEDYIKALDFDRWPDAAAEINDTVSRSSGAILSGSWVSKVYTWQSGTVQRTFIRYFCKRPALALSAWNANKEVIIPLLREYHLLDELQELARHMLGVLSDRMIMANARAYILEYGDKPDFDYDNEDYKALSSFHPYSYKAAMWWVRRDTERGTSQWTKIMEDIIAG